MLAIIRALNSGLGDDGILVLDEPTAALPGQEVHQLFDLVRAVRDRGVTVLYVTHRLTEVFELCDRVTVLRDGRNVATRETAELDHDGLVELIVGRPLEAFYPPPPPTREDVVLEVEGLCGETVDDVSLRIHEGEIVGVTGLVGSGSEHLLGLIFGGESPDHGEVRLHGEPIQTGRPSASVARGIAFASADRKRLGGMLDWTLRENVTLPRIGSRGALRWLGTRAEQKDAGPWLDRLDVVPPDPERSFFSLSGGNQQKVVLARWLRCQAQVLLLDEPTNGIDMGSKHSIYETLATVAADGAAVLLSSSDAEELCAICDRVLVMRDGRVAAQIERDGLSVETLLAEGMRRDDVEDQDKEEVKR
jgi:ribose transport system ATP-binding protein